MSFSLQRPVIEDLSPDNCLLFNFLFFNQNKLKQTNTKTECFTKYLFKLKLLR